MRDPGGGIYWILSRTDPRERFSKRSASLSRTIPEALSALDQGGESTLRGRTRSASSDCGSALSRAIYFAHREGHLRALPDQWRPRPSDVLYVVLGVACQFAVDLAYYPFHFKSLNQPENHLFKAAHGPASC